MLPRRFLRPQLIPLPLTTSAYLRRPSAFAWNSISSSSHIAGSPHRRKLYPSHAPTSQLQKLLMTIGSATTVLSNPERGDMLAMLGEVTGLTSLRRLHHRMCSHPTGRRILAEKPRIRQGTIDFEALNALPKDTFGYAYASFLKKHSFDPDGRSIVRYVDDSELAYVMQRYREMHDFWHVLFDLPPTVFGEIILKYIEMTQTQLPVCALSCFVGPVRLTRDEREHLWSKFLPWSYEVGQNNPDLLSVYYEEEFATPLQELRERLNITAAPKV